MVLPAVPQGAAHRRREEPAVEVRPEDPAAFGLVAVDHLQELLLAEGVAHGTRS